MYCVGHIIVFAIRRAGSPRVEKCQQLRLEPVHVCNGWVSDMRKVAVQPK
jgi:hypothetical protein